MVVCYALLDLELMDWNMGVATSFGVSFNINKQKFHGFC